MDMVPAYCGSLRSSGRLTPNAVRRHRRAHSVAVREPPSFRCCTLRQATRRVRIRARAEATNKACEVMRGLLPAAGSVAPSKMPPSALLWHAIRRRIRRKNDPGMARLLPDRYCGRKKIGVGEGADSDRDVTGKALALPV